MAYKPDTVELDVFLRSSRMLESFGICRDGQLVDCGFAGVWTHLYFEAVEEIDASFQFEPYENIRHKLRSHGRDAWDLWMLLATSKSLLKEVPLTWKGVKGIVGKGAV